MRTKVLVVGGTGLVGNALVRAWTRQGVEVLAATYHRHAATYFLQQLDMRDSARVSELLARTRPTIVAVPAANPFVDECERHPEQTRQINVEGTLNVARACRALNARMIFYSSDYVYDGVAGSYTEEDAPCPINEYGRQKAETERGVLAMDPRNIIIRTSGAYGWQWEPKNFALQIKNKLSSGQSLSVANDIRYNPTYVENLADITVALVEAGAVGLYHVVGADEIVRFDFACRVARAFGLDVRLLKPTPMSELGSSTPRPRRSSLCTDKLRGIVSVSPIGVDEGLRCMIEFEPEWRAYARMLPDPATKAPPA